MTSSKMDDSLQPLGGNDVLRLHIERRRERLISLLEELRSREDQAAYSLILKDTEIDILSCDLALAAIEIPVMAGPRGMQKAYDKGFADGQDRTWKAAQANTSARPDSISEPTEQPRPTETSPASALRQDSSGGDEPTQEQLLAGLTAFDPVGHPAKVVAAIYHAMNLSAPHESRGEVLEAALQDMALDMDCYPCPVENDELDNVLSHFATRLRALASRAEPGDPTDPAAPQMVEVPVSIFQGALNYIRHVGANYTERGKPHPQQWIVDGLELAAANQPAASRAEPGAKMQSLKPDKEQT